ncbi:hypothetical protein EBESD8_16150 [Rhodococcus aetherivorans]|nr:hypothetical protein EBESD8_16150 [Rhodococcus aetherivorans]
MVLRRGLPAARAAGTARRGFTLRTVVSFYRVCGLIGRQIHPGSLSELSRTTCGF